MVFVMYENCRDSVADRHKTGVELRNKLLTAAGIDIKNETVGFTGNGRPFLTSHKADFSVTHSRILAAAAVCASDSGINIGIDAEFIDKSADINILKKVADRYFCYAEQRMLYSADASDFADCFFRIWTRKESICKMSGLGLKGLKQSDSESGNVFVTTEKVKLTNAEYYISVCSNRQTDVIFKRG